MKINKDFYSKTGKKAGSKEDSIRKTAKLDPIKKSGKDKHRIFADEDDDDDLIIPTKRDSILDYYDDVDEFDEEEEYEEEYDDDDD